MSMRFNTSNGLVEEVIFPTAPIDAPASHPPDAPSEATEAPASVQGDPHLHFAAGRRADFRGVPGTRFALLSAPGLAANVLIEAADFMLGNATIHGTYMTELTMRCGEAFLSHNATNATAWGFGWESTRLQCGSQAATQYVHPYEARRCGARTGVVVSYATATFQCGAWTVMSTVQPVARYVSGASRNLDIKVTGPPFKAHGLIGQNLDAASSRDGALDLYPHQGEYTTNAQAEGAIDGVYMDYAVPSAYSTQFKYSQFDAAHGGEGDGGREGEGGKDGRWTTVQALSTHAGSATPGTASAEAARFRWRQPGAERHTR
jgi:hypothetical protein